MIHKKCTNILHLTYGSNLFNGIYYRLQGSPLSDLDAIKSFLFAVIAFILGRLSMAIEYAIFKDIARQKKKDYENKNH